MFNNENNNINYSECIGKEFLTCQNGTIQELSPVDGAARAKLQFYLDADGIKVITPAKLSYTPIVSITESGDDPEQDYKGKAGIKLLHLAIYEVKSIKNLGQTKFVAFGNGYICYCMVEYFK